MFSGGIEKQHRAVMGFEQLMIVAPKDALQIIFHEYCRYTNVSN